MDQRSFPDIEFEDALPATVALRNVFLHVTKACNLRCEYCYFSASRPLPDEMNSEEFTRLWPEMVALGPQKVIFTGGEPLLREDMLDLLAGLRAADPQHRVLRCLNTNGHLVTRELARRLVGLADEVRVSIDALPARNDALRGAGNFDAAMRAFECFYALGFEPKALVTVTAASLPDLEDLLCLLIERRITRINLNSFRAIGRGRGYREWQVDPADMRAAAHRVWKRFFANVPAPAPPEMATPLNCGVGQFLNIMPDGDVFPCHVLSDREFRCGNVRDSSLLDICHRNGLLGRLAALDFGELAQQSGPLAALTQRSTCMGYVYAATRSLPVWNNHLSLCSDR